MIRRDRNPSWYFKQKISGKVIQLNLFTIVFENFIFLDLSDLLNWNRDKKYLNFPWLFCRVWASCLPQSKNQRSAHTWKFPGLSRAQSVYKYWDSDKEAGKVCLKTVWKTVQPCRGWFYLEEGTRNRDMDLCWFKWARAWNPYRSWNQAQKSQSYSSDFQDISS